MQVPATLELFLLFLILAAVAAIYVSRRRQYRQRLLLKEQEAERLRELDRFRNQFYTHLTREFRTPLSVIQGMADQIITDPKTAVEGANLIQANSRTMLRLINQLLDLAKLEDQSLELKWTYGDVVGFLRYLARSSEQYAHSHNLSLRFSSGLKQLNMDYDPDQLRQVLSNLVANAAKYSDRGEEILVSLSREEENLIIEVADRGGGVSPEQIKLIFDRDHQARNMITNNQAGSGIGLAHSMGLVRLMGGSIEVLPNENESLTKGTVFRVLLPIRNEHKEAAEEVRLEADLRMPLEVQDMPLVDGKPSVLVVEDNPDMVHYLRSSLSRHYNIQVAVNGRLGIEAAFDMVPNLVISDVVMPEADGFELCAALKGDDRTSHVPVILLTAKADVESRLKGLRRGADAYLQKPFDQEELLIRMETLIARQQQIASFLQRRIGGEQQIEEATPEIKRDLEVEDDFIRRVREIVEASYMDENFSLVQLCQKIGMSRSQLFRKMKALIEVSPSEYIRSYRIKKAEGFLRQGDITVSEVAWKVGFKDLSHFSKVFQEEFGISPSGVLRETRK